MRDPLELAYKLATMYLPFMFALCFHEFAHGWMAKKRGDNTAEQMGRLTMNPMAHMDMVGTVVLPLLAIAFNSPLFFGWAKPVPFNIRNLKNPLTDTFWIALAGPLSNIFLAVMATGGLYLLFHIGDPSSWKNATATLLAAFMQINLFLAFFNLIPLHPLDGGKVLARFLPAKTNYWLEQNEAMTGMLLLVLVMTGALAILALPVQMAYGFLISLARIGI